MLNYFFHLLIELSGSQVKIKIKESNLVGHVMQKADKKLTVEVNWDRIGSRAQVTFRTSNGCTPAEKWPEVIWREPHLAVGIYKPIVMTIMIMMKNIVNFIMIGQYCRSSRVSHEHCASQEMQDSIFRITANARLKTQSAMQTENCNISAGINSQGVCAALVWKQTLS